MLTYTIFQNVEIRSVYDQHLSIYVTNCDLLQVMQSLVSPANHRQAGLSPTLHLFPSVYTLVYTIKIKIQ